MSLPVQALSLVLCRFTPAVEAVELEPPAPKAGRVIADSTWEAMQDRYVVVVSDGREIRGRLAGHDADNVSLVDPGGASMDVPKDSIFELREDLAPPREPLAPAPAEAAADAARPAGSFERRGRFFLLSPGIVGVPFAAPARVFYRWGFSVGARIPSERPNFTATYGFTFEHMVNRSRTSQYVADEFTGYESISVEVWTHLFRMLAEARIGGGRDRVFGYGLLGIGASVLHIKASAGGIRATDSNAGLAFPIGVGIQGLVGERLVVGFEPRALLDVFFGAGGGVSGSFDARLVLGSNF